MLGSNLLGKVLVHFYLIVLKAFSFVHIYFLKRAFQAHTQYGVLQHLKMTLGNNQIGHKTEG